jgi:hypothetical protein
MLIGQALLWGSWVVSVWACISYCINHIYFIFSEASQRGYNFLPQIVSHVYRMT